MIKAPDKKNNQYLSKHTLTTPLIMHFIGILAVGFTLYLYMIDGQSPAFWFMVINNSIFAIPYLLTILWIVLKKDFVIEIKECDDEIQINYYNGNDKFKSIKCKYKDIKDWGIKDIDIGISVIKKAYITDIYKQYVITLGYFPFDMRSKTPYSLYAQVVYADITEALKGNIDLIKKESNR